MTTSEMKDLAIDSAEKIAAGAAGTGAGICAVAACGVPGLSAAGITSGLAVLGAGSMMIGIGSVALVGVGAYHLTKFAINRARA